MNRNDVSRLKLAEIMHLAVSCLVDKEYHETCHRLESNGFRSLGSGNYGRAFTHEEIEGWVIKLSGRVDGDSFPAYVYWCIANPMPHVPEYHFPVFSESRELFMVMMPQYTDLTCDIDLGWRSNDSIVREFQAVRSGLYGCQDQATQEFQGVFRAARQIGEFFASVASFDMHSGNVMRDPLTGDMIITDPIHQGDTDSMISRITGVKPFEPVHQLEMFPVGDVKPRPKLVPEFRGFAPGRHEVNVNQIPQFLDEVCAAVKARGGCIR